MNYILSRMGVLTQEKMDAKGSFTRGKINARLNELITLRKKILDGEFE
ncbi:MAG: hypothetical protein V3V19_11415 [Cocleimonas sp.]